MFNANIMDNKYVKCYFLGCFSALKWPKIVLLHVPKTILQYKNNLRRDCLMIICHVNSLQTQT